MSSERAPDGRFRRVYGALAMAEREVMIRDVIAAAVARQRTGRWGRLRPQPNAAALAVRDIVRRWMAGAISDAEALRAVRTPAMMAARLGAGAWPAFAAASAAELSRPRHYGEPVPFSRPPLRARSVEAASDDELRAIRHGALIAVGQETNHALACHDVAASIADCYADARMEGGHFVGPRGPAWRWGRRGDRHSWVRASSGAIIDAAADQFGYLEIARIAPGDPRAAWYEVLPPVLAADGSWVHGQYREERPHTLASVRDAQWIDF